MKNKILVSFLLLSTLTGYMEWGQNMHAFLLEAELKIFSNLISDPLSVLHPFILAPIFGQLLLLIALLQKRTSKILIFTGIGSVSILFTLLLIIGILSFSLKILLSVLPFFLLAILTIIRIRN